MPPQRTFLKTAPADLHHLHAGGTVVSQCQPGDSAIHSRPSSCATFQKRASISGLRPQRHPHAGGFPCRASPRRGDVVDEFHLPAVVDDVGPKVEQFVGVVDRESDRGAVSRGAKVILPDGDFEDQPDPDVDVLGVAGAQDCSP